MMHRGDTHWRAVAAAAVLALMAGLFPVVAHATGAVPGGANALDRLVVAYAHAPVARKLAVVNRFFNALARAPDRLTWGVEDHWSTPLELLRHGAGDCEDFAIGKYFALRRMGLAAEHLQITYVRDLKHDRAHMVLIYRAPGRSALVLDSADPRILPTSLRPDLAPVFAFDERHVTLLGPDGERRRVPHAGRWRIHQWARLLHRASLAQRVATPVRVALAETRARR